MMPSVCWRMWKGIGRGPLAGGAVGVTECFVGGGECCVGGSCFVGGGEGLSRDSCGVGTFNGAGDGE